jgi:hypothetical protein
VVRVVVGVAHQIDRRARGLGGALGDDVGHLLQPTAVDGQEAEPGAQRAVLADAGVGEQVRKRLWRSRTGLVSPVWPVHRIPPLEELDPPVRQAVVHGAVDDALQITGARRTRVDAVVDVHPRVGRAVVGVHGEPVAAVAHGDALGAVEHSKVVVGHLPHHAVHLGAVERFDGGNSA